MDNYWLVKGYTCKNEILSHVTLYQPVVTIQPLLHDVILTPLIPMLPGTSTRKLVMMVPGYIGTRGVSIAILVPKGQLEV